MARDVVGGGEGGDGLVHVAKLEGHPRLLAVEVGLRDAQVAHAGRGVRELGFEAIRRCDEGDDGVVATGLGVPGVRVGRHHGLGRAGGGLACSTRYVAVLDEMAEAALTFRIVPLADVVEHEDGDLRGALERPQSHLQSVLELVALHPVGGGVGFGRRRAASHAHERSVAGEEAGARAGAALPRNYVPCRFLHAPTLPNAPARSPPAPRYPCVMVTTDPRPNPWPSRRALLLGVPAALLAMRLPSAMADDTEGEATPAEAAPSEGVATAPAPRTRELATFALG